MVSWTIVRVEESAVDAKLKPFSAHSMTYPCQYFYIIKPG
jgi:hypothetical protein